jgi:hypothetical protein
LLVHYPTQARPERHAGQRNRRHALLPLPRLLAQLDRQPDNKLKLSTAGCESNPQQLQAIHNEFQIKFLLGRPNIRETNGVGRLFSTIPLTRDRAFHQHMASNRKSILSIGSFLKFHYQGHR